MFTYGGLAKENDQVDCTGQRALVAGGTSGIGSGIALRYALCGANVWIIGRNPSNGKAVLDQLRLASAEGHRRRHPNDESKSAVENPHEFFSADLSKVEDVHRVALEIASKAGPDGVDYLVETQGGPPTGYFKPRASPSSPEGGFSVQCASRFGLAYLLTEQKIIKRGICFVASPGNGGSSPIDTDDLDFTKAEAKGTFSQGLTSILKIGQRHASVLDAVTEELAQRNPQLAITHLFPGIVATNAGKSAGFPTIMVWASSLAGKLNLISKPTIGSFPEVPFYLHSHPQGKEYLRLGQGNLFGPYLGRKELSQNVKDQSVRRQIWDSLVQLYK
ncbi:unnamed protein product [Sympodiomycopsis kandeliae]